MGPFPKVIGAVAIILVVCGVAVGGPGVAPRSAQTQGQIREEVTVALKLLQAYVTKDGKPITDLTAADFEVTDNGQKVNVTHFENHIVGGGDIAPAAPVVGPQLNRKFFFFFDFAFTDARSARKSREAALHFMDTAVRPGDEIGVLSYSPMRGLTIHEYLSTDHAHVRDIIEAFGLRTIAGRAETLTSFLYADELRWMQAEGTPLGATEARQAAFENFFTEQAQAQTRGVVDEGRRQGYTDQARQFSQTFANLARAMRYVPGWKNLILFSSGISRALIYGSRRSVDVPNMNPNNPDQMMAEISAYDNAQSNTGVRTEFAEALKELKNANSPIYAIDCTPTAGEMDINNPVGPSTNAREFAGKDSLIQLASESGGKYFSNTINYKDALAQVSDITSAFYVLGYSVPAAWDGAFHKIKVRVTRPGCKVISQNGYYNPKPFNEYSRFERLLQMTDLALSDNPLGELPANVSMGLMAVVIGGWPNLVAYVGIPKEAAAGIVGKRTDAYLLIFDEDQGKSAVKSFRLKLPEGGPWHALPVFAVPAKPGRYTCRIIVQNAETGKAARGSASIAFGNPVPAAVWLDPPLLLKEAAGWADLSAAPETMLSALFGYDPAKYAPVTEALPAGPQAVFAAVRMALGAPAMLLDLTATDIQEGVKTEIPVTVIGTHQDKSLRTYLVELTFGGLKPGPHTLIIKAKDTSGAEENETKVGFVVK